MEFRDLFELANRVVQYENLLHEEKDRKNSSKWTYYHDPNYEVFSTDVDGDFEVNVAEINIKKPIVCEALVKPKAATINSQASSFSAKKGVADASKGFSFDITKAEQIFDLLVADKQITFSPGHKIPSASELAGKEYCKYHNSWRHSTNGCVILRNTLQKAIEDGKLKFSEKSEVMGVDSNPFPTMVSSNVIGFVSELPRNKVNLEGSESSDRGKQKVVERDSADTQGELSVEELKRQLREAQIALIQHGCCPKCKASSEKKTEQKKLEGDSAKVQRKSVHERLTFHQRQERNRKQKVAEQFPQQRKPVVERISFAQRSVDRASSTDKRRVHHYSSNESSGRNSSHRYNLSSEVWVEKGTKVFRPRMVKPPITPPNRWKRLDHPKFPRLSESSNPPMTRTQKRRWQRNRAEWRKEKDGNYPVRNGRSWKKSENQVADMMDISTSSKVEALSEESFKRSHDGSNQSTQKKIHFGSFPTEVSCNMVLILPLVFEAKPDQPTSMDGDVEEDGEVEAKFIVESSEAGDKSAEMAENETFRVEEITEEEPMKTKQVKHVDVQEVSPMVPKKVVLEKPNFGMTQQLRPLYIKVLVKGRPLPRVLVDNGSVLNVVPVNIIRMLGKTTEDVIPSDVTISGFTGGAVQTQGILPLELTVGDKTSMTAFFIVESTAAYNLLLGREWIHPNFCIPSTLHQILIFWDGDEVKIVEADSRPFVAKVYAADAQLYDEEFVPIRFIGRDSRGRPKSATMRRTLTDQEMSELFQEMSRPTVLSQADIQQYLSS